MGSCLSVSSELWWIRGKRLQVGYITQVDEGKNSVLVDTSEGRIRLNPVDRILMVEPSKQILIKARLSEICYQGRKKTHAPYPSDACYRGLYGELEAYFPEETTKPPLKAEK